MTKVIGPNLDEPKPTDRLTYGEAKHSIANILLPGDPGHPDTEPKEESAGTVEQQKPVTNPRKKPRRKTQTKK